MTLGRCTNCGHVQDIDRRRRCTWCGAELPAEHRGPPPAAPPAEREAGRDYRWAVVVISMLAALAGVTMALEAFDLESVDPQLSSAGTVVAVLIAGGCAWMFSDPDEWTTGELVGRSALGALVGAGMGFLVALVLVGAAFLVAFLTCSGF